MTIQGKKTRAQRKAERNAEFARRDSQRREFEAKHPVLSGVVKVTEYVPPSGHGKRVHIFKTV